MILNLPVPPSINEAFANRKGGKGRGRIKTAAYRRWLIEADKHLLMQKRGLTPMRGPLVIEIRLPATIRGDVSNRIKIPEDFLVSRGLTGDDRHNHKISIERDESVSLCVVTITAKGA